MDGKKSDVFAFSAQKMGWEVKVSARVPLLLLPQAWVVYEAISVTIWDIQKSGNKVLLKSQKLT